MLDILIHRRAHIIRYNIYTYIVCLQRNCGLKVPRISPSGVDLVDKDRGVPIDHRKVVAFPVGLKNRPRRACGAADPWGCVRKWRPKSLKRLEFHRISWHFRAFPLKFIGSQPPKSLVGLHVDVARVVAARLPARSPLPQKLAQEALRLEVRHLQLRSMGAAVGDVGDLQRREARLAEVAPVVVLRCEAISHRRSMCSMQNSRSFMIFL